MGGHLTYTKMVPQPNPPPGTYVYGFTTHNNTVCSTPYCSGTTGKAYIGVKLISGGGGLGDWVELYVDQRLYLGSTRDQSWRPDGDPMPITLFDDDEWFEHSYGFGGPVTDKTVQYKVGAWMDSKNWPSSGIAATPGL